MTRMYGFTFFIVGGYYYPPRRGATG